MASHCPEGIYIRCPTVNGSQYSYDMGDTNEDSDDSSPDTAGDIHSDDEPTRSMNQERGGARSKKQRLHDPAKGATSKKFPKIMKKVQHVLDNNSKVKKKKGRNRTILVFYYRKNEKKRQSSKKEKEEVPEKAHTSDDDSSLPGTSQDTEPSAPSLPKRVRKWFFP